MPKPSEPVYKDFRLLPRWPLQSRAANFFLGLGFGILAGHFLIGH